MHDVSELRVKRERSFSSTGGEVVLSSILLVGSQLPMVHSVTCRLRASNGHEQHVPQLEHVSVTEHSFDQKYTTSWVMDDLHHQKSKYSQVTAS